MDSALPAARTVAPAESQRSTAAAVSADRLDSVDVLRGIVMVLMALDHMRYFLHWGEVHGFNALDLTRTSVPVFLTRWITHFCAPVFIFLAGTGAFLSLTRGKSKRDLSWFLVTRGLWLIVLDLTVINWAILFALDLDLSYAIVLWAIGWSMIVLAALIHLPLWAIGTFGVTMIVTHNLLDGIQPADWGSWSGLWKVLHEGGPVEVVPGHVLFAAYPLIPWLGVMAAGYAFGTVLQRGAEERQKWMLRVGVALTMGFVLLRFTNLYGNPSPWTSQRDAMYTVLSFLDCHKYPPSLCFLLMTLGPALVVLSLLDRRTPAWLQPVRVFGRVPMFYYLLHMPLVHGVAILIESLRFDNVPWLFGDRWAGGAPVPPPEAGSSLPVVYLAWLVAVALLYPACRWFAELKRRRRDAAWLSYF